MHINSSHHDDTSYFHLVYLQCSNKNIHIKSPIFEKTFLHMLGQVRIVYHVYISARCKYSSYCVRYSLSIP